MSFFPHIKPRNTFPQEAAALKREKKSEEADQDKFRRLTCEVFFLVNLIHFGRSKCPFTLSHVNSQRQAMPSWKTVAVVSNEKHIFNTFYCTLIKHFFKGLVALML